MTTYKRESLPHGVTSDLDKDISQPLSCNQYPRGSQAWPSLCAMLLTWEPTLLDNTDQGGTTAVFWYSLEWLGKSNDGSLASI